jgi:hypothetical protein
MRRLALASARMRWGARSLVKGIGTQALALVIVMACVGSVRATSLEQGAGVGIGRAEHISYGSTDLPVGVAAEDEVAGAVIAEPVIGTSGGALVINATFDSSITTDPNAAAIEAMINDAIAIFESQFNDPITVSILFRYSTTDPGGAALGSGVLALSDVGLYAIPWTNYINALVADATTANDTTANASLPGSPLSTNVVASSADGRAIGMNTPPVVFADGSVGVGGSYDGIVTLNSNQPFAFTRPPTSSTYDALRSTEHEMDEVLALGSYLNGGGSDLRPQDLFTWSAPGTRNVHSSGTRYFSIDGGATDIVGFNQKRTGDFGDWLSGACPQATPYVQNAFGCKNQVSDVTSTSPEGINLDVVGYDLITVPTTTSTTTTTTTLMPLCASTPASGCRLAAAGGASVQLKEDIADTTKNQFKWKWAKGAATMLSDFKDPVGGSATYRVCVYDGSLNAQPLMEMDVPPGGTCGTAPCWKASGASGFSYKNKAGTTTGITAMKLKAGVTGKAGVQARGKGANLPMPTLGLTLPVTVQLLAKDVSSTECWQTTFTAAKTNDPAQFSAKGP